jgi:hypothetical protein
VSVDYEFYETPETYTRWLFDELGTVGGTLFEPCVGSGAILRAAPQGRRWVTNDLDKRWPATYYRNAKDVDTWRMVSDGHDGIDWTITNPPFTPAIEIIEHALTFSTVGVAMHLRASIHEPVKGGTRRKDGSRTGDQKAARWRRVFAEKPPTGILWLPRFGYQRSAKDGKWKTDSVCACWCVWLKDPRATQVIRYAPEWVLDALEKETPEYRARMDRLMGYTGSEAERQAQRKAA